MAISITPFLWYNEKAEEAARFYAGIIPDSKINAVTTLPADTPSGPPGSVVVVDFVLAGRPFLAMTARNAEPFNFAVSIMLNCDTQAEVDRLWDALLEGGTALQCGWLRDRYGLCWQIVPRRLFELTNGSDRARAKRATEAMLGMVKLDLAKLEAA